MLGGFAFSQFPHPAPAAGTPPAANRFATGGTVVGTPLLNVSAGNE
jgi:hypothetical protein